MADFGFANLSNANLINTNLLKSYFKNTILDNVIVDSSTLTDSCFENNIVNKIQCTLMRYTLPGMPPYETTYEQRDNYKINYP